MHLVSGVIEDNVVFFILFVYHTFLRTEENFGLVAVQYVSGIHPPSEPLFFTLAKTIFSQTSSTLPYNLVIILNILLNFLLSYKILAKIVKLKSQNAKIICVLMSLIFTFSPYFLYQSRSHPVLLHVWLSLLTIYIFLFSKIRPTPRFILTGVFLAGTIGFSNYLGYFTIIFLFLHFFAQQIISRIFLHQKYWNSKLFLNYFLLFFTSGILTFLMIRPYILANFGISKTDLIGDKVQSQVQSSYTLKRPIEDFFTFSLRPWYFFLPSQDNPFFGQFTQKFINWLQNDKGLWLARNYFPSEHTAGYLGWVNFIFALFGLYYVLKELQTEKPTDWTSYHHALAFGLTVLGMAFLAFPPYVTINLHKIYLPSYLLYKYFPMFRVLSRMGVFILLGELIFTGFGLALFLDFLEKKLNWKKLNFLALFPFFVLSFMEFFVPFRITDISVPPRVFVYIAQNTPANSSLVVFPYSQNVEALFWTREHQRFLVNPRDFVDSATGFNSLEFTSHLPSCSGLLEAKKLGVDYLVYFPLADTDTLGKSVGLNAEFFANCPLLKEIAKFTEKDAIFKDLGFWSKFIWIENYGTKSENSAILYQLNFDQNSNLDGKSGKLCPDYSVALEKSDN